MKNFNFFPLLICLVFLGYSIRLNAEPYSGGNGKQDNPYQIAKKAELKKCSAAQKNRKAKAQQTTDGKAEQQKQANFNNLWSLNPTANNNEPSLQNKNRAFDPTPADGATDVSTSVTLMWFFELAGVSNSTYELYFGPEGNMQKVREGYIINAMGNYQCQNLYLGTTYNWQVKEYDEFGNPVGSADIWSFTTTYTLTYLNPQDNATDVPVNVSLQWHNSSNAPTYELYFGETGNMVEVASGAAGINKSFQPSDVEYGTEYQWQIHELFPDGVGTGPIWSFTTEAYPVAHLTYLSPEDGATDMPLSVNLSWHNSPDAISYDLYFGPAGNTTKVAYGPAGAFKSYEVNGLMYNTTYEWEIIEFFDGGGVGVGSPRYFSTVSNCVQNPVPPVNTAYHSKYDGHFEWDEVYGATGYKITVWEAGIGGSTVVDHVLCATNQYDYPGVWEAGQSYSWDIEVVSPYWGPPCAAVFWGFTIVDELIEIDSYNDLLLLSQFPDYWDWGTNLEQTADIDASSSVYLDDSDDNNDGNKYNDPNDLTSAGTNDGFNPIGSGFPYRHFMSNYNGNNHTISGLTINRPDQDAVGFISYTREGNQTLSNIRLEDALINAGNACGILVGKLYNEQITNCRVNGTVTGADAIGLLAGEISHSDLFTANITNCSATGTAQGLRFVGGLIGKIENQTTIENSFASAMVYGTNYVSGFVGYASIIVFRRIVINNSFAMGDVIRTSGDGQYFGGFCNAYHELTITNCYSTVNVSGNNWNPTDKGFIGYLVNSYEFNNNYWDTQSSGQSSTLGQGAGAIEGKTTAQMQQQATFENWNFDNTWSIDPNYNDGYPYLQWQDCFNPNDGGSIEAEQTICEGNTPEALSSIAPASGYLGTLEYKWQYSTTSATEDFENIDNSNNTGYAPGALNETTWFRRLARVTGIPGWSEATPSNVVQINVIPLIIHITENGGASLQDGASWETAYDKNHLQQAIDDACQEIWVAAGTYYPTTEAGGSGERYKTFQMKEGIALYGGFAGTESNSYDKSLRDFESNETILSGDIGTPDDNSDNCWHVFYLPDGLGLTSATLIDGFTICDGNAKWNWPHSDGGGIYIKNNAPEIKNCIIKNNSCYDFGGGILNSNGASQLTNCTISNNNSGTGGGMYSQDVDISLTNCVINGNQSAYNGGGIMNGSGTLSLINCSLYGNHAITDGNGGGIFIDVTANANIKNSIIWGNSASGPGNQLYTANTTNLDYCCYANGDNDISGNISTNSCNTSDPMFVNAADEDFRLLGNSPAVNSGKNSYNATATDIRGQARIQDVTIDMGAYEWTNGVDPMAQYSWTGNISSAWNETGNWSEGQLPTADYDAVIPTGLGNYPLIAQGVGANCLGMEVQSDASLTISPGGSLITYGNITNNGAINVQRSISNDVWHLISSPISNATAAQFTGDYLQYYNGDWVDITDPATALSPAKGYSLWSVAKSDTYSFTGNPNTGNQSHGITANEWNLLGNPYPSPIDWSLLDDTYGAVYYWDPSTQNNKSWNNGEGAGVQYVPAMQGFWIKPTAGGSFSLNNDHRTHNGSTTYYKNKTALPYSIELQVDAENDYYDQLFIVLDENTTEAFDFHYDAWKLFTSSEEVPQLYSFAGTKGLSIDRRPQCNEIPLGFYCGESGAFCIKVNEITDIAMLVLEDKKTSTFHELTKSSYCFDYQYGEEEQRFKLHLSAAGIPESCWDDVHPYVSGGNIIIQSDHQPQRITLTDIAGRTLGIWENAENIPAPETAGLYLITVEMDNQRITRKITIQ